MPVNPTLSIIILSYNTSQITLDCLHSIFKDKGLEFDLNKVSVDNKIPTEIIVIDNASTDDSVAKLHLLKQVKLISNRQNLGFAVANNQGLKIAKGNYVLLLNSDTIILHSAISQTLNWLSSHPEAHLCTAQLLNPDKSIQPSGGFFPNLANVISWSLGLDDLPFINYLIKPFHPHSPDFYTHEPLFLKDHRQDWVTGAFILARSTSLKKVGGFDENYFMYGDEVDLIYRLHRSFPKAEAWYLVGPQIIHLGGASAVKKTDPILHEYQGVLYFFKKHHSFWQYQVIRTFLKINAYLRSLVIPSYRGLCSKI